MRSGLLRHKVEVQVKVVNRDSTGAEVISWEHFTYAWSRIEPLSGREYFLAQQAHAATDYKITMRYQAGIRPDHRILWGTRIFEIVSPPINTDERNMELTIYCKEFIPGVQ